MISNNFPSRPYQQFYDYLAVLSEEQIRKLRNIAIGVNQVSTFTPEEIDELEMKVRTRDSDSRTR